jgi:hypothetical protein
MGKGSGSSAPAPDPQIGQAALMQAKTGEDWLTFSKEAFAVSKERQVEIDAITKRIGEQQIAQGDQQFKWAESDRDRYEKTFKPIEDEFIAEARNYGSEEKQQEAAAAAKADVTAAAAQQRDVTERQQMSMGVNPASGRFQGIQRAGELGTAIATAGAQNQARTMTRDKGLALKADVANLGRGLPAQSAQAASLGLNAGSSAAGLYGNANQQYIQSTGIMGQGFRGAMAGYQGQGDTLNRQYATQVDAWKAERMAEAQESAGIGSAIGSIAGLGLGIWRSDKDAKTDKRPLPEGEALKAVESMPVERWRYKDGVADGGEHVGPYAQDFKRETGRGDGKTIAAQDAIGLTMKAVQDLSGKVDAMAERIGIATSGKNKPSKQVASEKRAPGLGSRMMKEAA